MHVRNPAQCPEKVVVRQDLQLPWRRTFAEHPLATIPPSPSCLITPSLIPPFSRFALSRLLRFSLAHPFRPLSCPFSPNRSCARVGSAVTVNDRAEHAAHVGHDRSVDQHLQGTMPFTRFAMRSPFPRLIVTTLLSLGRGCRASGSRSRSRKTRSSASPTCSVRTDRRACKMPRLRPDVV